MEFQFMFKVSKSSKSVPAHPPMPNLFIIVVFICGFVKNHNKSRFSVVIQDQNITI